MTEVAIEQNPANGFAGPSEKGEVEAGNPLPIGGAHQNGDGVNFVLFSRHATRVHLELYQNPDDSSPTKIIDLDPGRPMGRPLQAVFHEITFRMGRT